MVEQEVEALPQDPTTNPYGNAFKVRRPSPPTHPPSPLHPPTHPPTFFPQVKELVLEDEQQAQRVSNARTGRAWVVRNPRVKNRLGQMAGYKLHLPDNPLILGYSEGLIARKGAFATKNLWVTPYDVSERYPAGDYPTQSAGGDGLPAWTQQNRSVKGADVVLWPAYGLTHVVRAEDFGTMPVASISFSLHPTGFFDRNPAQDLPPECNKASQEVGACCGGKGNPSPPN